MSEDAAIRRGNLQRLCKERNWGQKDLYLAMGGEASGAYSLWPQILNSPKKTFGEKLARKIEERLDLPRGWLDTPSRDAARRDAAGQTLQAHTLSLDGFTVVPSFSWDELLTHRERLPPEFHTAAPDDSMAPAIPAGTIVYFDSTLQPASGDGVLVCDDAGNLYIRQYKLRRADHWEAHAFNQAVLPLDSRRDGLTVLAVVTGQRARWSGLR